MREKREAARRAAQTRRQEKATQATNEAQRKRAEARAAAAEEVIPWLRALGFSAEEARRAAECCETVPDASLEQRVRLALTCFGPRTISPAQPRQAWGAGAERACLAHV